MVFKNIFHKILAIIFSISVILSGFALFFNTYPDNFISTAADGLLFGFLKSYSWVKDSMIGLHEEIKVARESKDEIVKLRREVSKLREMLVDYSETKRENARLLKYYDIKKQNPNMRFVSASVIGRMPFDFYGNFFIDAGKMDGISLNDAVITESGLVGRISRVGPLSSNVKTILASDVNIGVIDSVTGNVGIISGLSNLAKQNLTRMTLLRFKDSVNISNILITSGLSGMYPKSLKVGTVKSVEYEPFDSSYSAIVEPFEKIDEIKNVFVITNFSGKGKISNN